MTNQTFNYTYQAFGLTFLSEIAIQELIPTDIHENIDVVISKANFYSEWLNLFPEDDFYVVEKRRIMLHVPNVAIFSIEDGDKIIISPFNIEKPEYDIIRLYLLGTCVGAILMQRKILPLHGSVIEINGKAYGILGECGAGKSTLAKAFLNRGYRLLTDDVIAVTFTEKLEPFVLPAYPQQKLWLESLEHYGIESSQYKPLIDRETKFAVPAISQFVNEKLPLAGLFELNIAECNEISITAITKIERLHTVFNQTFRNFFLFESGLMEWHFETSTKLVDKVPLYKIERPTSKFTAYEIVELILAAIKEEKVSI